MTSNPRDDILADIVNLYLTKCFGLVSFVVMVWDHLLTLSDEVTFVWNGRKGLYIYLYFVNRYFIPLSFVVNIYAYFGLSWTQEVRCMTMIGVYIAASLMLFRIVALYHGNKYVQLPVFAILFAAIAVNAWLLSRSQGVSQSSLLVHSCIMIFDPSLGPVAACAAILPLVYDTVVCLLVIVRLVHWRGSREAGNLQSTLMKEGLSYYFFGCSVMLASTFTIIYAAPSARNIAMQLQLVFSVTVGSRMVIHLRKITSRQEAQQPSTLATIDWAPHNQSDSPPTRQTILSPERCEFTVSHSLACDSGVDLNSYGPNALYSA